MARPSKYGEKTEAIRVPVSKLEAVKQAISDQGFVQNSDAVVEDLVDQVLNRCEEEGLPARAFLLHLLLRDLCERLDRFDRVEQRQFVARLIERYLTD